MCAECAYDQRTALITDGGALPTDYTYTGQKQDASGLLYYNARYYDPELGTFISPDTIVPEPGVLFDYNRYMYVRGNPLNMNDPSGHCPAPPEESGSIICFALFIEPDSVPAGPFTVHGDGRTFSSDSDPGASRGYIWIRPNGDVVTAQMNPSGYIVPAFGPAEHIVDASVPLAGIRYTGETIEWADPSEKNTWVVTPQENGNILVEYDLVISGILETTGAAPHINGSITFRPTSVGSYDASFTRDGFPWGEAYYHDGQGNVHTIFQDAAVRGNPYDLFGIELKMSWRKQASKFIQSLTVALDQPKISTRGSE